jgi:hypothetical protein
MYVKSTGLSCYLRLNTTLTSRPRPQLPGRGRRAGTGKDTAPQHHPSLCPPGTSRVTASQHHPYLYPSSIPRALLARRGGGFVGHNTQFGGYRAAGRCSEPRGETLLLSPPQPQSITNASARPRVGGLVRGWSGVCSARTPNTDCIKQENTERAQDRCPWSPSISRRVLGIKGLLSA